MKNAASVVKMNKHRRAVCVSAPGARSHNDEKITDILYRLSKEKSCDLFAKVKNRFDKIIKEIFINIMIFDCIWPELIEKTVMNA